jgi:hypothetical protein
MRFSLAHKPVILLTLLSLLVSVFSAPVAARAQDAPPPVPPVLQISAQAQDAVITYGVAQLSAAAAAEQLPKLRYDGYQLPLQYITLAVAAGSEPQVAVRNLQASALTAAPQPLAPELPPALGWEPDPNYTPAAPALPVAPVFIAREGLIRGQRYVVVAVSPIYAVDGAPQLAGSFEAVVTGATPVAADAPLAAAVQAGMSAAPVQVPVNAAALTDSYKLTVAQPGLQEVLYSDLGLTSEPANLRLTVGGDDVAVEKAGDRLRFYAPAAGDRWNAATVYWLTLESGSLLEARAEAEVEAGAEAGTDALAALGAYEEGVWRENKLYKEGYAGADGDHWFHADLKALKDLIPGTDLEQTVPVTVPVATVLPPRAGTSTFAVTASSYAFSLAACYNDDNPDPGYFMQVQVLSGGNLVDTQTANWKPFNDPNCIKRETTSTASVNTAAAATTLLLRLAPNGVYQTGALLEAVSWRRPVELNFRNVTTGIEFTTDAGAGSLALRNLPAAWRLYDVTQPRQPALIAAGSGGSYTLRQTAATPASRYLLAVLPAVQKPAVGRHSAVNFGNVKAADAIYIGPAAFADALAPLLALRQQQGYTPLFVDVQQIYDVYSAGQVSAVALRNFLRAESDWQNTARQISVVLAGDATMDPFAYGGIANDIVVAAWMDDVDPHQAGATSKYGEAACDACIAQLDGDDPVTGDNQAGGRNWFAADVWLGRLPARDVQELTNMVAKLVAYDKNSNGADWRSRKVFLADNYIKALDTQMNARPDEAGDFAALSDNVVNTLPNPASARRIYYDPAPDRQMTSTAVAGGYFQTVPRTLPENWRISDIVGINAEVIATLSQGAGLVTYNGHSNHFYYARTEDVYNTGVGDKWLLNAPEVALLSNTGKEFVMLSMTCYTAQFVKPAANGTLDEWLIRHQQGGAIAVWGPTGLSVVSGHELLQQGFIRQLADARSEQRLGNLVEAGYTNLLTQNGPLDPLMTFVLLGDPLTAANIPMRDLYLPAIQRR